MKNRDLRAGLRLVLAILVLAGGASFGQVPGTQPARADEPVVLDFPEDGVELKTLAEIVTKRLGIPIIYDDSIEGKKVILRVPQKVPESALLGILQSALRMKQMALVDADQPGWKQIISAQNLAAVARPAAPGVIVEPGTAVTQVIALRHVDPAQVVEAIRPLLTQPGGNIVAVPGQKLLIVSDYPTVISKIEQVARMLDSAGPAVEIRFVPLREADAAGVVTAITQLWSSRETFLWGNAGASGVFLLPDERLNQVVVLAPADRMKEVVDLISGMDRATELVTRVYRLKTINPQRIDRLVKELLGPLAKRAYQATIDRDSQSLVVSGTPGVHERLDALIKELDRPATEEESPIRFYKLKNTKAVDVLATIQSLLGEEGSDESQPQPQDQSSGETPPTGVPYEPQSPIQPLDRSTPRTSSSRLDSPPIGAPAVQSTAQDNSAQGTSATMRYGGVPYGISDELLQTQTAPRAVRAGNATVTADVNTNSIIVIAPPAVQQLYTELIKRLDERRPQVQIECTIVTLDTSEGFTLGVDTGIMGGIDAQTLISFSSFGVAVVDPVTGALTPTRGRGGTFALLNPSVADIVIRALSTNTRARLVSAPQLLVNDNGKGQLRSVAIQPYAEIVDSNASQAITSFGGQAEAGTSILIEPHISKDDYLQLTYTVELSNFTGNAANSNLPPPSQSNSVNSTVTIPDGYTIVVGGLNTKNFSRTFDSVPFINQIPIIKYLFGIVNETVMDRTLFVFIRPVILRDDKFEDLKFLSSSAATKAELPGDFPASEPIPMR